jgi:hypothetical protein
MDASISAFADEFVKISDAALDKELKPYLEAAKSRTHARPSEFSGMGTGAGVGAVGGLLGGAALGIKGGQGIPSKIFHAGTHGIGGLLAGTLGGLIAGSLVGDLVGKVKGEEKKPYTKKEQRDSAIAAYLNDYDAPEETWSDWQKPKGLTPAQAKKHKQILKLEESYYKRTGRMPY